MKLPRGFSHGLRPDSPHTPILTVSQRLLADIEKAPTTAEAEKHGALALGFVLGLETARMLAPSQLEALYIIFDEATGKRVVELGGDYKGNG